MHDQTRNQNAGLSNVNIGDDWKTELRQALRSPGQLAAATNLSEELSAGMAPGHQQFPVRVPMEFAEAISAMASGGNLSNPLLRQVFPGPDELIEKTGFSRDPVGDLSAMAAPGVIHKYKGRVLLIATGSCAIHCRYCFRRHYPYSSALASRGDWAESIAYLQSDQTITEVIVSGGDPLILDTPKLARLTDQLADVSQLRRLRLHSRIPVVLPTRVNSDLLDWIGSLPWPVTMVIHANHPAELTPRAREALRRLKSIPGLTLLNQAVLLNGINDHADVLCALAEDFFEAGVLPYYLHLLDPVQGAAHFQVTPAYAVLLMNELRERLPGYLVPRLVREVAGKPYKLPLL